MTRGAIAKAIFLWHFGGMKFLCVAAVLLAGGWFTAFAQQEADEKYIGIYGLIQQADGLVASGDPGEAVAALSDAQNQLQQFQKIFPNWNPNIVSFRLNHLADEIAELKSHAGMVAAAKKSVAAMTTNAPAPANLQLPTEIDNLRTQLQTAQVANELWQAKLREALAAQPAAIDANQLADAQEKVRSLMKQIDLLNASRGASPSVTNVTTQFITNTVTVFVTNTPSVVVTNLAAVFAKDAGPTIITNYIRVLVPDTNALEMARLDTLAAVKNFNDEHDRVEKLAAEISRLQANPVSDTNSAALLADLRVENAQIKSELATLRAAPAAATGDVAKLTADLKSALAQVAALQSEAQIAALEKIALQNKLQQTLTATNAGVNAADYESQIRELTQDRDNLIEKLALANQKNSGKNNAAQLSALNDEVLALRARLAVAEAAPVPYSPEELALFKSAVVPPTNPNAEKKSIHEMPAGTAELVASAQAHFVHQEYDAAEADYIKILDHDQNNGIALANLATIELQQGKLAEAEQHVLAALAQAPDDAYNLSTLGYLKFRQEKYDDALKSLSRAAQIDPNNPEIQNYLGVTLSHQGQRKAAETALRRAIQLNPNYAPAHNNLAVIYLSQTPPLAEMARWHYLKAIEAGQPHNADLEKMLADKGAPVTP